MLEIDVTGLAELRSRINELGKAMDPDKVEPILKRGADVITQHIRTKVKRGPTGNLQKALKTKKMRRIGSHPAPSIAAVDRKIAPHAHLVEYGHEMIVGGPKGKGGRPSKTRPRVQGRPFWRPGVEESKGAALSQVEKELGGLVVQVTDK